MKLDRFLRLAIGVFIALVFIIAIAAMLFVTESALNVWDRLLQGPRLLLYAYVGVMIALVIAAAWLVLRMAVRRSAKAPAQSGDKLSRTDIEVRIKALEERQ